MTKRSYIDHNIISQIIIFRKITADMVEAYISSQTPLPEDYFAFWVFISIAWSFVATFVIIVLPIYESMDDIQSIFYYLLGKEPSKTAKIAKLRESTADLWVEPPKWRTEVTHWVNQDGRNIETQMIINVDLMNYRRFFWKVFFQMPKCWFTKRVSPFAFCFSALIWSISCSLQLRHTFLSFQEGFGKDVESTADLWAEPRSGERKLPTEQTNMAEIFET